MLKVRQGWVFINALHTWAVVVVSDVSFHWWCGKTSSIIFDYSPWPKSLLLQSTSLWIWGFQVWGEGELVKLLWFCRNFIFKVATISYTHLFQTFSKFSVHWLCHKGSYSSLTPDMKFEMKLTSSFTIYFRVWNSWIGYGQFHPL